MYDKIPVTVIFSGSTVFRKIRYLCTRQNISMKTLFLLLFAGLAPVIAAQPLRVMFYNVENFFDTEDDPTKNDNQFTPDGAYHWTTTRYMAKRDAIFRVIAGVGEWEPPAVVGLCEIENRKVLEDLITDTPLVKYPYRIIHKDSPDQRGIDVALLYRNDRLKYLGREFIRIRFPDNRKRTRDILYARLLAQRNDTIHIFVNHWPSRSGGQRQSESARILAATILRHKADSIFSVNPNANLIIIGDLNDNFSDASISKYLKALPDTASSKPASLFNLTAFKTGESTGTIKYRGKWSVFDQIIVSGHLLQNRKGIHTHVGLCRIFRADFLFEKDTRYLGAMPFRTYIGQKYNRGFSDHLPVFVDLILPSNSAR
jgi:endonuclease/exonuclease/phosphatase family metal-dependent hydrolase